MITDDMVEAARRHVIGQDGHVQYLREALEAALDATPTVEGWWWCSTRYVVIEDVVCVEDDCPGPHRAVARVGPWIGPDDGFETLTRLSDDAGLYDTGEPT